MEYKQLHIRLSGYLLETIVIDKIWLGIFTSGVNGDIKINIGWKSQYRVEIISAMAVCVVSECFSKLDMSLFYVLKNKSSAGIWCSKRVGQCSPSLPMWDSISILFVSWKFIWYNIIASVWQSVWKHTPNSQKSCLFGQNLENPEQVWLTIFCFVWESPIHLVRENYRYWKPRNITVCRLVYP